MRLHHEGRTSAMPVSAGILHTIIFCRALGALKPQEVDCEILSNITFVSTADCAPQLR